MGVAFYQTAIDIKIPAKNIKKAYLALCSKGLIQDKLTLSDALKNIGWHHQTLNDGALEIIEIGIDKITERTQERFETLAPFINDGSFVRFQSEENKKDYALCVFAEGEVNGYGWFRFEKKTPVVAAIGTIPDARRGEYIYDEEPSAEKLKDHRYWAVAAFELAQQVSIITLYIKRYSAKEWDLASSIIRACKIAESALLGTRPLNADDLKSYTKYINEEPQHIAHWASQARARWLKAPRKRLAQYSITIEPQDIETLLSYRTSFVPGRDLRVDEQEGCFHTDVLDFLNYLGQAPWYQQVMQLRENSSEYLDIIGEFHGLMSDATDTADLTELLILIYQNTGKAVRMGPNEATIYTVSGGRVFSMAPDIYAALTRIGEITN